MRCFCVALCALVVLCWQSVTFAASAAPSATTAPSTQPSGNDAKQVYVAFAEAINHGDVAGVQKWALYEQDDLPFMNTLLNWSAAFVRLNSAAQAQFGTESTIVTGGRPEDLIRQAQSAELKITGDEATVAGAPARRRAVMRRINGQWRVDMRGSGQDATASQARDAMEAWIRGSRTIGDQIKAGKFITPRQARDAFARLRAEELSAAQPQ